jgi:hypothetical protein
MSTRREADVSTKKAITGCHIQFGRYMHHRVTYTNTILDVRGSLQGLCFTHSSAKEVSVNRQNWMERMRRLAVSDGTLAKFCDREQSVGVCVLSVAKKARCGCGSVSGLDQ